MENKNPEPFDEEVFPILRTLTTVGVLGFLLWFDVLQGFPLFAFFVAIWLFGALCLYLRRSAHSRCWRVPRRLRISLAAVAVFLVLDLGAWKLREWYTECQVEKIAEACNKYKADHGQFPERLEELVPHYLAAIPDLYIWRAGFNFSFYYGLPDKHYLLWSPRLFGSRTYSLERAAFSETYD